MEGARDNFLFNTTMKITINNIEIELKNKMRAMIIYEQITDKPFNPRTISDLTIYMYSVILANKPDLQLTFSELMEILDEQPELFTDFNNWLTSELQKQAQFNTNTEDGDKKKLHL